MFYRSPSRVSCPPHGPPTGGPREGVAYPPFGEGRAAPASLTGKVAYPPFGEGRAAPASLTGKRSDFCRFAQRAKLSDLRSEKLRTQFLRSELGRTRPARGGGGLPRPWRDGGLPRPWRDGSAGFPHGLAPLTGPITTLRANLYSRLARLVASTRKHRRYRNKIPIYRNFVTVSKFIRETRRFSPRRGGKSSTLL